MSNPKDKNAFYLSKHLLDLINYDCGANGRNDRAYGDEFMSYWADKFSDTVEKFVNDNDPLTMEDLHEIVTGEESEIELKYMFHHHFAELKSLFTEYINEL